MTQDDPFAELSPDARARLEELARALERTRLDDLPLYAVRPDEPSHRRAVEAAGVAARTAGLDDEIRAAQAAIIGFLARAYANEQLRMSGAMLQWGGSGPVDDRVRVTRSLADAVTGLVVWNGVDDADRAELIGAWSRLLP